jgi:hypothetical protein
MFPMSNPTSRFFCPEGLKTEETPVAVGLRLKIQNGLISEAEQLVIRPENNLLNPTSAVLGREASKNGSAPRGVHNEAIPESERPRAMIVPPILFLGCRRMTAKAFIHYR